VAGLSAVFLLVPTVAVGSSVGDDPPARGAGRRATRLSRRPGQRLRSLEILRECVDEARRLGLPPGNLYSHTLQATCKIALSQVIDLSRVREK
jgi:hypothetical protein